MIQPATCRFFFDVYADRCLSTPGRSMATKEGAGGSSSSPSPSGEASIRTKEGIPSVLQGHDLDVQLDLGKVITRARTSWWKFWIPSGTPPPPPASLEDAPKIPLSTASIASLLTYTWVTPIMRLGYQRTLQAPDLWKLDHSHTTAVLASTFDEAWSRRKASAEDWNAQLGKGIIQPNLLRRLYWFIRAMRAGRNYSRRYAELDDYWRQLGGRQHPSISLALNDTIGFFFWSGGMFKVIGDISQLMGPLVVKAIINFAKDRESAKSRGEEGPSLGIGFAMAVGLFLLTMGSSIGHHQFFWRSMITGVLIRAALIKSIYNRGMNLTGKARVSIMSEENLRSVELTIVLTGFTLVIHFHYPFSSSEYPRALAWTAPIQITVCLIILLFQLGPSALAGFALFVIMAPIQERAMAQQFKIRKSSMNYTDERAKTLLEVLGSMRVVKYFSYEEPFLRRISTIRRNELKGVKSILISQSANAAIAFSIPVLAATLAFVTYTHVTRGFDVAVIFSSLSLFGLLRQPMMFLPRALSATSDARSALFRLHKVFEAEVRIGDALVVDLELKWVLQVDRATFEWEETLEKGGGVDGPDSSSIPFRVQNVVMHVQRGSLVAVVGRVGSGKSSLLLGLLGEMRRVSGSVVFGGRVAYCSQTAWIQNASVRDNILFGKAYNKEKYWRVIEQASLLPDLEVLLDGDLTEIGEKGVNLSVGQKQRINIARALYYDADIVILLDPLSAVDAHVGEALFHTVILGALRNQGKTVILVTHALHFLSYCDYIYTLHDGSITEQGTHPELVEANGEFARLDREFGGSDDPQQELRTIVPTEDIKREKIELAKRRAAGTGKLEGKLMIKEQRTTGSISAKVYKAYVDAGRGFFTAPLLIIALLLSQGCQITSSYTLVWWQENAFHRPFSFYQTLYALLGVTQSIFTFVLGLSSNIFSYLVSQNLHHDCVFNIFHAPMSFFDTTPMGRIIGVFSKDIDMQQDIDNQLPVSLRMLILMMSNVLGAVVIITVVEHYFIIVAVFIAIGYQYFAAYYRASALEVKRLGKFSFRRSGYLIVPLTMGMKAPCCDRSCILISQSH
ncbi:unnamed protein product [Cyclocybe aegerita]|uniref:ABC protein n=1 Tax=Cyclocybe aegerita TaxID=1973307 RepID=A0A8S0WCX6_CYCAE|nr:unnamed protein product [Cyclocybe aegerita]